ncbi:MAG: 16S rRNA (cytosine(967)-C(5))-methyltransferase RsmB [Solirubrobacteraceae bacterium]
MSAGRQRGAEREPGGGGAAGSGAAAPGPARAVAFAVLGRVFEEGAYADRALLAEADRHGLSGRDRALATAIAYGAIQRRATLDHVVEELAGRRVRRLDSPVLHALRLGLQQILFMGGIPDHAAVDESVELAKAHHPRGAGLVNAVLRRAAREGLALVDAIDDSTPDGAALRHSHPGWVARLWWDQLGADHAKALMAADNESAEAALRANALLTSRDALVEDLREGGLDVRPADLPPDSVLVAGALDAHAHPLHERGAFMPQSRASSMVARVLDPRPGERVLDLCAAPGGKTTHLAALMGGEGEVVALERHPGRARALSATCRRMHAKNVEVRTLDAREPAPAPPFDRVLVDPPCTGLGTLRSRPDLRWRVKADDVSELAATQSEILAAGAAATRPGGTLVYSTCTISSQENEGRIDAFLRAHPAWTVDDLRSVVALWHHPTVPLHLQTLPHRDGTDGFFIARLRRAA